MFAHTIGYNQGHLDEIRALNGVITLVSGNQSFRKIDGSAFQKFLVDPQLYLATLDAATCPKTCIRLASYPWFQTPNVPACEEGKSKEWKAQMAKKIESIWAGTLPRDIASSVASALTYQVAAGCTSLILPTPLVVDKNDHFQVQAEWLDRSLEFLAKSKNNLPVLATISIDESQIGEDCFFPNGLFSTIVDQISSRDINGVYLVVAQTHKGHPFHSSKITNKTYLYLTKKFHEANIEEIVVNFADIFGIACIAAGASLISIGMSQASRRLSLKNFEESGGGGKSFPRFYSNKTIGEYLSESDLQHITKHQLLRRIEDRTVHSASLIDALKNGQSAATVPEWAESQNNTSAAYKHFVQSLLAFTQDIASATNRKNKIVEWLEDARMMQADIEKTVRKTFPDKLAPVQEWINLIKDVVS